MKNIILLILFIFNLKSFIAQINIDSLECEKGKKSAANDFNNKSLKILAFDINMSSSSTTYTELLTNELKKTGFNYIRIESYFDEENRCYNTYMSNKIIEIIGSKKIDSIRIESIKMDKNGKGDRFAQWPLEIKSIRRFIYCNINYDNAKYNKNKTGILTVRFDIDTSGTPVNFSIKDSFDSNYEQEAIRVIKLIGKWIPATRKGIPISETMFFPFEFNEEQRINACN